MRLRLLCAQVVAFAATAALVACTVAAPAKKKSTPIDPGDDFSGEGDDGDDPPNLTPGSVNQDSGAFGAAARPAPAPPPPSADAGAPPGDDDAGTVDPPVKAYCAGPLAAGDLAVVELMITSRAGSGDDGEWVEIASTRDCWLHLDGVTVASPRGTTTTNSAALPAGTELGPHATFVVADSADPAKNHAIPGLVVAWTAADVLKNDGDTVTVTAASTTLDAVTYPSLSNLTAGRSFAFPADCAPTDRPDFQRWSLTFTAFAPGFQGTPNAPNADVTCF